MDKTKEILDSLFVIQDLTIEGLSKHVESTKMCEHDWFNISTRTDLPGWFIEKYKDELDWGVFSRRKKNDEDFLDRYRDYVDWEILLTDIVTYSESFVRCYADKVNWWWIAYYEKLSEDVIEKYLDLLKLEHVVGMQSLSAEFIRKHKLELDKNLADRCIRKYVHENRDNLDMSFVREMVIYFYGEMKNRSVRAQKEMKAYVNAKIAKFLEFDE